MLDIETRVIFGIGLVAAVYWFVAHMSKAGILSTKRSKFLANNLCWLVLVVAWAVSDKFSQSLYEYLVAWLGGVVATLLFKAGAKDNETRK